MCIGPNPLAATRPATLLNSESDQNCLSSWCYCSCFPWSCFPCFFSGPPTREARQPCRTRALCAGLAKAMRLARGTAVSQRARTVRYSTKRDGSMQRMFVEQRRRIDPKQSALVETSPKVRGTSRTSVRLPGNGRDDPSFTIGECFARLVGRRRLRRATRPLGPSTRCSESVRLALDTS